MKSQGKKGEEQPSALRWFKVMYPETYRQTRRPLWFEGTHLQAAQDREQGIIPMICQGEQVTILDPRAIVLTVLTENPGLSPGQVDYSPICVNLTPWERGRPPRKKRPRWPRSQVPTLS